MILIFLQSLLWFSNPYLRKQALKTYTKSQFQFQIGFGNILLNLIDIIYNKKNLFSINAWSFLCIINTYFASICLNHLTYSLNASAFISLVQPLVIIFTALFDHFIFDVHFKWNQLVGLILIVLGITIFKL